MHKLGILLPLGCSVLLSGCLQALGLGDYKEGESTSSAAGGSTGGSGTGTESTSSNSTSQTGTTSSNSSSTSSVGGGSPECTATDTSKCPTDPLVCNEASCTAEGTCSTENDAAHTMCAAGVCDGNGACIGCVDATDCPMTAPICNMSKCIPGGCTNGVKDGSETDTDCGGSVCNPCINTKACLAPTDCQSGNCAAHVCAPCTVGPTGGCDATSQYCDTTNNGGTCTALTGPGTPCTDVDGSTCLSTHCEEGVCCDQACTDECESCLNKNSGRTEGTCGTALLGKDPKGSCATEKSGAPVPDQQCLLGTCDGTATTTCGFEPPATPCGNPASCPSPTSQETHQACNATGTCNQGGLTSNCTGHFACDVTTGDACATTCTVDGDCVSGFHCDVSGGPYNATCQPCANNSQCTAAPDSSCDTNAGSKNLDTCVICSQNSECSNPTAVCDVVSTSVDFDKCVQCTAANHTACTGALPNCDVTHASFFDTCVACSSNAQCSGNTPKCTASDACGCTNDADCASAPAGQICDTSKNGGLGQCAMCTPAEPGICNGNPNGTSCLAGEDTCGCTGASGCASSPQGFACIFTSTCGCNTAGDCMTGDSCSNHLCV